MLRRHADTCVGCDQARRSRMRKQAECEELAAMVAQLSAEKASLAAENHGLRLENTRLQAENSALQQLKLQGPTMGQDGAIKA